MAHTRNGLQGWLGLLLVATLVLLGNATPAEAAGRQWHVAPTGDDRNIGNRNKPLATIQAAIDRAGNNDVITVHSGTYIITQPIAVRNKRGKPNSPFTIRGEGTPVIRTSDPLVIPVWDGILGIWDSSYVRVSGLRIENSGWFGFRAENSDNVVFKGNQSYVSLASAIYSYNVSTIAVVDNDVSRFCDQKSDVRGSTCQEGISIVKTNGFLVARNVVHDAPEGDGLQPGGGEGIDAKEGSKNGKIAFNTVYNLVQLGIYVDAWDQLTENIEVFGNRVYNTANGIAVNSENGGTVRNVLVHDNVIYNIGYHGIGLDNSSKKGRLEGIRIYNNTIYRTGYTTYKPPWCVLYGCGDWGNGIFINTADLADVSIHDNIVVGSHSAQISMTPAAASAVSINTNVLYPRTGFSWAEEAFGTNALVTDPLFVDQGANDFHLQLGSPAIGVGVGGDPLNVDADYVVRPTSPIDLGAFTYNGR